MTDSFVAVDIETTGLDPRKNRMIEIGAVRVRKGQIEEVFQTFVNPRCVLPSFIVELTGIETDMLLDAPDVDDVMRDFLAFVGDDVLLGHHVIFDYSFLKRNAVNMGIEFERKGIDTLKLARIFLPELEKRNLAALCKYYGIVNKHAHRATDDALATVELYFRMKKQFFEDSEEWRRLFEPEPLIYQMKKESSITMPQLRYLKALMEYHQLTVEEEPEYLSKNEASRRIDGIILQYGKIR